MRPPLHAVRLLLPFAAVPPLLAWVFLLGGCGNETPEPARTPEARLAWIHEAAAEDDQDAVEARLASWPSDAEPFREAEETQVALTWRLQRAVAAGNAASAIRDADVLGERYGGGLTPQGMRLDADLLRGGIVEGILDGAADAIVLDDRWNAQLDRIEPLLEQPEEAARHAAVRTWVNLSTVQATALEPPAHDGPLVIAVTDHFALGEPVLSSVLRRWARDLGPQGLRVVIVPPHERSMRAGMRRVQVSPEEAREALQERAASLGVDARPALARSDLVPRTLDALGKDVAVFVIDRKGRVVARAVGVNTVDPRGLEEAVIRVSTR